MCICFYIWEKALTFTYAEGSNSPISLEGKKNEISKAHYAGKAYLTAASSGKLNILRPKKSFFFDIEY